MEDREDGWRFHYSTVGAEDPDCAVVGTAPLQPSGGLAQDCGGISGGALPGTGDRRGFRDWQGRRRSFFFVINRICFLYIFDGRGAHRQILSMQMHILDIAKACINSRQEHDKKTSAFALKTGQRSRSFNIWDKFIYKFFYGR